MTKTIYVSISEVNELQTKIMLFIQKWVKDKKTPVPHRKVLDGMKQKGVANSSTIYALKVLITKGYIRKAIMISNKTSYVQIRRI